ncbi:MAG: DUF4062 domain-containing protein, partial [Candidatus Bathyarchaeota archaeon]|nr:DUF4062 domain-containing protein [Candidatus Bathyarchaeota archaeon]
ISRTPVDVCENLARECHLYVIIIGERYGWVIPRLDKSVTEREFEIARADNAQKILVYEKVVHSRESRAQGFLQRLKDFEEGYFLSQPFSTSQELYESVKEDISLWITQQIAKGRTSEARRKEFQSSLVQKIDVFSQRTLRALRDNRVVYDIELYVKRAMLEQRLALFLRSPRTAFVLIGDSGIGKTNLLCSLVQDHIGTHVVLFYNGTLLNGMPLASAHIEEILGTTLEAPRSGRESLELLLEQCETSNSHLLVVVDAINEFCKPIELFRSLDYLVGKYSHRPLKLVVSCRTVIWDLIERRENMPFFVSDYYRVERRIGHSLERFTVPELQSAYPRYAARYQLKSGYDDLSEYTVDKCRNPLMLRLISETYEKREIPPDVPEFTVFEEFFNRKVKESGELVWFLLFLASEMRARKSEVVPKGSIVHALAERQIFAPGGDDPYIVARDRFLVYERKDWDGAKVGFTYEKFGEFILAKVIAQGLASETHKLLDDAESFPPLKGALEYIVYYLADPELRLHVLTCISERNEDWLWFLFLLLLRLPALSSPEVGVLEKVFRERDVVGKVGTLLTLRQLRQRCAEAAVLEQHLNRSKALDRYLRVRLSLRMGHLWRDEAHRTLSAVVHPELLPLVEWAAPKIKSAISNSGGTVGLIRDLKSASRSEDWMERFVGKVIGACVLHGLLRLLLKAPRRIFRNFRKEVLREIAAVIGHTDMRNLLRVANVFLSTENPGLTYLMCVAIPGAARVDVPRTLQHLVRTYPSVVLDTDSMREFRLSIRTVVADNESICRSIVGPNGETNYVVDEIRHALEDNGQSSQRVFSKRIASH